MAVNDLKEYEIIMPTVSLTTPKRKNATIYIITEI